jgi:outer membrane receptor protein involved in Fe transport
MIRTLAAALATATCAVAIATPAAAQTREFNVPAGPLKAALDAFARQSGRQIIYRADVQSARSPGVRGAHTTEEALDAILAGTGFLAKKDASGAFAVVAMRNGGGSIQNSAPMAGDKAFREDRVVAGEDSDIVVTGSRIRGSAPTSPVTTVSREAMRDAGQNTLADAIRTIPQNFGGGQNPGIGGNVPESRGIAAGLASTLNLRGLWSDATLALLNGHRLAYSVANQSVDVSTIPVMAIDRLEIVADGSSALYGSDAVGGVANIILRRDYQGLSTSLRFGGSTDGGNQQQQYGAIEGTRWSSGGLMLAYEFERDTAIMAKDRSYAASISPGLYLYPAIQHHNVIASAHQDLGSSLTFEIDGLFNTRASRTQYALDSRGDVLSNGARTNYQSEAFAFAPSLRLRISPAWEASVVGTYGGNTSNYDLSLFANGAAIYRQVGCYCNAAASLEGNASGSLFALPAGDVKMAFGGGWRTNRLHGFQTLGGTQNIKVSQDTYYGFGEIRVPLIGPGQNMPLMYGLTFTAAVRWEDYPGIADVATPKFGVIFSPSADIDLKATWGKSFKAPTLFQLYNVEFATLYSAATRGGLGYPASATAILLTGGNSDLKPERATSWSATMSFHPRSLPRARVELSYFNIDYRNRIVTPIPFPTQSLSNPQFDDLVDRNPTAAAVAAISGGNVLFQNATGAAFNPANVVAIIYNTNLNAATQLVRGVDASANYVLPMPNKGSLTFQASASYIRLSQRLSPLQPDIQLAGTIFNVPHVRARGGAVYKQSSLTLAGFVNFTGGVSDVRSTPTIPVRPMTTVDLTANYVMGGRRRLWSNLELGISAQNLFNVAPSSIRSTQAYETPYDSTNYMPFGRVLSVSLTKKW